MRIIHRLDSKTIPLPYSLDLSIGSEGQFDGKLKGGDVSIYLDIKLQSAKIKSYNNSAALRATFNILLSSDNSSDSPQKSNLQLIFNSEGTGETSDDEDQGGGTIGLDFDLINNAVTGDSHEIVRFNSTNKNGMLHTRSVELRFQPGPESTSLTGAPAHLFNTPLPGEDLIATIPLSIDSDSDIASYTLSIAETNADGSVESVQIPIRVKRKR
ncbi:MAG: hypothetical protein OEV42_08290 [Deltaproteobacteria bacterium]|nr:hypothetical protein [Deltaproteobacteria bacterium]